MKKVLFAFMMVFLAFSTATAEELFLEEGYIETHAIPEEEEPLFLGLTDFGGFTSNVTNDGNNVCFDAIHQDNFRWGDTIAMNVVFKDTTNSNGLNTYDYKFGFQDPSSGEIKFTCSGTLEFSNLKPNVRYDFCIYCANITPPKGPNGLTVPWGAQIVKKDGEDGKAAGKLGTITMSSSKRFKLK